MQTTISTADGRTTIKLQGRFDFDSHREFREAVETAIAAVGTQISVDLGMVDYLDSSALGMLLMLRDKAKGANRDVSLSNCKGSVKQVLDIANFSRLFRID